MHHLRGRDRVLTGRDGGAAARGFRPEAVRVDLVQQRTVIRQRLQRLLRRGLDAAELAPRFFAEGIGGLVAYPFGEEAETEQDVLVALIFERLIGRVEVE